MPEARGADDRSPPDDDRDIKSEATPASSEEHPPAEEAAPQAPLYAPGSNVAQYKDGKSYYHPEEQAAVRRRRAGVTPRPEAASHGLRGRARDSFGGTSEALSPGDAPGMPSGGRRFEFETPGFEFATAGIDGVPVAPADGSDEDLGDMNDQLKENLTRARTQGGGELRRFLDSGRGGHGTPRK